MADVLPSCWKSRKEKGSCMSKQDPYVVCLVPTRGDRPRMLNRCIEMMSRQTLLPREVVVMNDPPIDPAAKDITWRYRVGVQRIIERHPEVELILLIEDDDWYSRTYVEVFYNAWNEAERPDVFGIDETYYYHIGLRKYHHQFHVGRASAFSTGVTNAIERMSWPPDDYSYTDLEIWKQMKGRTFRPSPLITLGIKGHKEGSFFGGIGHNDSWNGLKHDDKSLNWIRSVIDEESFQFYFKGPTGEQGPLGPNTQQ